MKIINSTITSLGLYMYTVVAAEISAQNNIDEKTISDAMIAAIWAGTLKVRDPNTGAYFVINPGMPNPSPYVNPLDVNIWLSNEGYPFTWTPSPKPVVNPITKTGPKPFVKGRIASAFDGIYFSEQQWNKYLASPPKWLLGCRVARGSRGGRVSATWDPCAIAAELNSRGISAKKLDVVFLRLPEWSSEWQNTRQYLN